MRKLAVMCLAVFMLIPSLSYAQSKVGIIGAMDVEVNILKEAAEISRRVIKADMEFCEGKLGSTDVVIVKSGMGKVNTGICAQILIDLFNVTHIINSGVAGALNDELEVGDIVVAYDCVQHDFDVSHIGFRRGEIPYTGKYAFETDKELREKALKSVHELLPEVHVIEGRACAGDIFLSDAAKMREIVSVFKADCVEMESGAIGQVCYLNHVPFVVIRAISDKIGTSVEDYKKAETETAELCAKVTEYMIRNF